jgi:hypothetical protein
MKGARAIVVAITVAGMAAALGACSKARGSAGNGNGGAGDESAPGDMGSGMGMGMGMGSGSDDGSLLPPGHGNPLDTAPKEGPRMMAAETYIRSYLALFGGLAPLAAQKAAAGSDGTALFDTWDDYLGALGLPDYRFDIPRQGQTNALMLATFERLADPLCARALEHDTAASAGASGRLVYDFDMPPNVSPSEFAARFDKLHRVFLGYPAALAPAGRIDRFYGLYESIVDGHADAGASRFSPAQAGWACVCAGLVRHPEFHLY